MTEKNRAAKERLILALDVDTLEAALNLVDRLKDKVGVFKVGMELYNSVGPEIVRCIGERGSKVFVDLKFHDIPNTVGRAAAVMVRHGAFMFNVHAAGGREMMHQAARKADEESTRIRIPKPLVLGVTVLTSMGAKELQEEVGIQRELRQQVVAWAKLAKAAGLDGVVASPQEITLIREACGPDFVIVTPGVRPAWAAVNDQKRIMTPMEAVRAGATYLVVGRPITGAPDPVEAAQRILEEMEEGLAC